MRNVSIPGKAFILVIRFYQRVISPLLGPRCRFYPTCSAYMIEAITRYGVIRGVAKGMCRFVRCNPLNPGGYDPVEPLQKVAEPSEADQAETAHDHLEEG